jgi:two-component system, chemotaxis family, sensor kinase CheA
MSTPSIPTEDAFLRPEEMAEIRRTFFDQGREALDALGREVLALEGQTPTAERLKPLRRAAHTLKGDCASIGFGDLSSLAHALEDCLVAIETKAQPVTERQADGLLDAVDALRQGLEAGAKGRPGAAVQPVVQRLRAIGGRASGGTGVLDRLSADERRRIAAGQAGGRHALHVVATFGRGGGREREALARRILAAIPAEVVAQSPPLGALAGAPQLELVVIGLTPAADLLARLARFRGVRFSVVECAHEIASAVGEGASGPESHDGETVRIEATRVDEALNLVGELVTVRSTLAGLGAEIEPHLPEELALRLSDAQSLLGRVLQELQRSTMRMRMVPADRVFRRFARVVRDLGRQTGKRLSLHVEGENTELDRGILDALEEPLLHLVRNAVTHGIEDPPTRAAAGKSEEARLTIRAGREGNQVLIEVADDGRGIDVAAVRRRGVERGLVREEDLLALSDSDALQLIFNPGLSTAPVLTEHAGRGVGLDVVRDTVQSLRGSVTAENLPGSGALFRIRVPLTIAIIQALLFRVSGRHFAVPLSSVVEIAQVAELTVQRVGAVELVRLRDHVLGLVRLSRLLGLPDSPLQGYVMVLQCGGDRFGLLTDEVSGEQELVIKRVHDRWIRTPMVAGASIVGGGVPTLILDVLSVYRSALSQGAFSHD